MAIGTRKGINSEDAIIRILSLRIETPCLEASGRILMSLGKQEAILNRRNYL
jgi:hypothetical protein